MDPFHILSVQSTTINIVLLYIVLFQNIYWLLIYIIAVVSKHLIHLIKLYKWISKSIYIYIFNVWHSFHQVRALVEAGKFSWEVTVTGEIRSNGDLFITILISDLIHHPHSDYTYNTYSVISILTLPSTHHNVYCIPLNLYIHILRDNFQAPCTLYTCIHLFIETKTRRNHFVHMIVWLGYLQDYWPASKDAESCDNSFTVCILGDTDRLKTCKWLNCKSVPAVHRSQHNYWYFHNLSI